jgi:protease IV
VGEPSAERLADATFDRRRMKRRLVWWRALAVIAVVALAFVIGRPYLSDDGFGQRASYIARVPIVGVIDDNPALIEHLSMLAEDPRVAAVFVALNSPGGTFSGSEALYHALRDLTARKPSVAVVGGVAASGAYMAAIATDHIVARAGSVTGSVGVIFQMPHVNRLLDDLGIDVETVRSGPLKAVPSPVEETTEPARAATEALIADLFDQFMSMVTLRRDLDDDALTEVRKGGIFTGRRALELHLIDAIGGEDAARNWLERERGTPAELQVVDRPVGSEQNWLAELVDRLASQVRIGAPPILDGPWAIWHQ